MTSSQPLSRDDNSGCSGTGMIWPIPDLLIGSSSISSCHVAPPFINQMKTAQSSGDNVDDAGITANECVPTLLKDAALFTPNEASRYVEAASKPEVVRSPPDCTAVDGAPAGCLDDVVAVRHFLATPKPSAPVTSPGKKPAPVLPTSTMSLGRQDSIILRKTRMSADDRRIMQRRRRRTLTIRL